MMFLARLQRLGHRVARLFSNHRSFHLHDSVANYRGLRTVGVGCGCGRVWA